METDKKGRALPAGRAGPPTELKKAQRRIRMLVGIAIAAAFVGLSLWIGPQVMRFSEPAIRAQLESDLRSFGVGGWVMFLGIQVLQVVIAMIPGEPVEIFSGVLYGAVGGTLTCLLGVFLGSVIVTLLVKKLGMPLVTTFISEEKIHQLWFLRDEKRFEALSLLLFFLPGTPKDLLTWAVGLTAIPPVPFFLKATLARIPSVLTSTLVGASLILGDFANSALIFVVTGVLSLAGIGIHHYFISRKKS